MDVLVALARRGGEPASKDELIDEVWQGRAVSDDALTVTIYELRKLLGDNARSPIFIETIPGRGYRWLPPVEWRAAIEPAPSQVDPGASDDAVQNATTRRGGGAQIRRRPLVGSRFAMGWLAAILVGASLAAIWIGVGDPRSRSNEMASPTPLDEDSTLAVLPLSDESPGHRDGDRTFADGLTDSLIHELARASPIRVMSRTSARRFAGSTRPLPEIADRLGADLLIEGAVIRESEIVRIEIRLIDGRDDHHLWAQSFDVAIERALDVQTEIAAAVAREIRSVLGASGAELRLGVPAPAAGPMPENALDAYLRGLDQLRRMTRPGLDRALSEFRHAVELAPEHATIWARLSETHSLRFEYGLGSYADEIELARSTAERALALDPGSPSALHSLGLYRLIIDLDLSAAEASLRRSLASDPMHSPSWQTLTWVSLAHLRFEEARSAGRRALQANPESEFARLAYGTALWVDGDADAADRFFAEHSDSETLLGRLMLRNRLRILIQQQRPADAWAVLRQSAEIPPTALPRYEALWSDGGLDAVLRELLAQAEAEGREDFDVILLQVWLGELDRALDLVERLVAAHHPDTVILNYFPSLQPLHGHPRFEAVLDTVGLPSLGSTDAET